MRAALVLAAIAFPSPAPSQELPRLVRWTVALSAAPAPATAPIAAGDVLVVPLQSGKLAAHRVRDGQALWTVDLLPAWPMTADGDHVYVVADGALHARRLETGALAWRVEGAAPTAPPVVRAGWVIVASKGSLAALRASDGAELWRREIATVSFRPAIDGDVVYVSVDDARVAALDLPTGKELWTTRLNGQPFELLALGGRVYVGAADKRFYAIDAASGNVDWHRRIGAEPRGRPTADEDHVYSVALDNVLRAFDRRHGALEWNKGVAFRPAAGPIVLGTIVTVPGGARTLPAFSTADGRQVGAIEFGGTLAALPALVPQPEGLAALAVVTGDLENQWKLSLLDPAPAVPAIAVAPLTALPGAVIPLGWPEP